jgi:hypothetical protein
MSLRWWKRYYLWMAVGTPHVAKSCDASEQSPLVSAYFKC